MALNSAIVLEVRPNVGSDTNGGGFKVGASGTDWSLQTSPQYSVTDGVTAGTTTITSATANFGTDVVGNLIYVQGGTGSVTAGWYEITARTNSTTITVDRSTGLTAGTGVTLKIGGALATVGLASGIRSAGVDVFVKYHASPEVLSSASANVSGGIVNDVIAGTDQTNRAHWVGYDSTRTLDNVDANRPTVQIPAAGVSSVAVFTAAGSYVTFRNLIVDGNSKTSITGFSLTTSYTQIIRCHALRCTVKGINLGDSNNSVFALRCSVTTSSGTCGIYVGGSGPKAIYCEAYGNTCHGFQMSANAIVVDCIASGNTGGSVDGFNGASVGYIATNCTAYGNGRAGFDLTSNNGFGSVLTSCIAYGNGSEGFRTDGVKDGAILLNCAGGSNTSGNYSSTNLTHVLNFVSLSGDPFTNAGGGDFSLNNTAGAGAALRGISFTYPRSTTTSYADIGAAQHQDSGGSGGGGPLVCGRLVK